MKRQHMLDALTAKGDQQWDFCIIGGGATGLGVAVDAASRGFSTLLLEQYDFAKGTSSRATKLVHGAVLSARILERDKAPSAVRTDVTALLLAV